jgi:ketosteroid isomerase-like protein
MPDNQSMEPHSDRITAEATVLDNDKQAIVSIVKEMSESMTGAQSTRHWASDALWFDIPPFASKGVQPAREMFDRVFAGFESCHIEFLDTEVLLNGDMGIVCTVQKVNIVLRNGTTRQVVARETDCFERRAGTWQLIHQHASVPSGGDWDGRITTG